MMTTRRGPEKRLGLFSWCARVKHGGHNCNVREVASACAGMVAHEHVSGLQLLLHVLDLEPHGFLRVVRVCVCVCVVNVCVFVSELLM